MGWERLSYLFRTLAELHDALTKNIWPTLSRPNVFGQGIMKFSQGSKQVRQTFPPHKSRPNVFGQGIMKFSQGPKQVRQRFPPHKSRPNVCLDQNIWPTFMGWERLSELFRTLAELHDALTKTFGLLLWGGNVCLTCLEPWLNFMMP
jgi:hypothetical protein